VDLALGGFEKAGDQPQRRGLAAAGGAEQADQLPVIDPQRDIIDHRKRSKPLGQATQINGRQTTILPLVLYAYDARAVVGLLFIAGST
jgi:hypothetical protein